MEAHQLAVLLNWPRLLIFLWAEPFSKRRPANGFYLIERGSVVLEAPQPGQTPAVVDVVAAGELLGWSWLFPLYSWQFDARARNKPMHYVFPESCSASIVTRI